MVNKDRIVPIQKMDLLSMIGTAMKLAGTSFSVIEADNVDGDFSVTGSGAAGNKLANQPLKSCDFKTGVTSGTVYFVAAYDYEGFKKAGNAPTMAGATVKPDGVTLYSATLSSSTVTIAQITPEVSA